MLLIDVVVVCCVFIAGVVCWCMLLVAGFAGVVLCCMLVLFCDVCWCCAMIDVVCCVLLLFLVVVGVVRCLLLFRWLSAVERRCVMWAVVCGWCSLWLVDCCWSLALCVVGCL